MAFNNPFKTTKFYPSGTGTNDYNNQAKASGFSNPFSRQGMFGNWGETTDTGQEGKDDIFYAPENPNMPATPTRTFQLDPGTGESIRNAIEDLYPTPTEEQNKIVEWYKNNPMNLPSNALEFLREKGTNPFDFFKEYKWDPKTGFVGDQDTIGKDYILNPETGAIEEVQRTIEYPIEEEIPDLTSYWNEMFESELMPNVLTAMEEYLAPYYGRERESTIAKTSAMGRLGGGLEGQNISDLQSKYFGQLADEAQSMTEEMQNSFLTQNEQELTEKTQDFLQNLKDTYGAEATDLEEFLKSHEAEVNRELEKWAAEKGMSFEESEIIKNLDLSSYLNDISSVGQATETATSLIGELLSGAQGGDSSSTEMLQNIFGLSDEDFNFMLGEY
jgi:hypothetical protein